MLKVSDAEAAKVLEYLFPEDQECASWIVEFLNEEGYEIVKKEPTDAKD